MSSAELDEGGVSGGRAPIFFLVKGSIFEEEYPALNEP